MCGGDGDYYWEAGQGDGSLEEGEEQIGGGD